MNDWNDIQNWRKAQRVELRRARLAIRPGSQSILNARVEGRLKALIADRAAACVGFYWPLDGEFDLRPLMRDFITGGGRAALPAVTERHRPVAYLRWWPGEPLTPDALGVPAPKWPDRVAPDVLLVPMLGFDDELYRLGFGTGYLDRTLATIERRPLTIGVCHELGRLRSIHPQPHDIPMDLVVTEAQTRKRAPAKARSDRGDPPAARSTDSTAAGTF